MREVLHNILTRRNWFFGAVIVLGILWILSYRAIDPTGFNQWVNGIFRFFGELVKGLMTLAIAVLGIRIMWGYKPWWLGGKK